MDIKWCNLLDKQKQMPYFKQLMDKIKHEVDIGKIIYPDKKNIFSAFELTDFNHIKVVILGQDPYHGPNQAHGLSFSVQDGTQPPPSLKNIFKELQLDLGIDNRNKGGCLLPWAKQGVLLLNAVLTVEAGLAQSHQKLGWEIFTDSIIESLNHHPKSIVYMLWGASAQKKQSLIDSKKHLILCSPHPSPLSAHRGFFGNKHFSQANRWLSKNGRTEVNWKI